MLQAFVRTLTELLDSKKAAYSFLAAIMMAVLIVYFKVDRETALIIVSPLGLGTVSEAHVDAARAKASGPGTIKEMAVGQLVTPGAPFETQTNPGD